MKPICFSVKLCCFKEQRNKCEHDSRKRNEGRTSTRPKPQKRKSYNQMTQESGATTTASTCWSFSCRACNAATTSPEQISLMATWVEQPSSLLLDRETVNNGLGSQFNQTGGKGDPLQTRTRNIYDALCYNQICTEKAIEYQQSCNVT